MKHCSWILMHGHITTPCDAPATHQCKESDAYFCDHHAEDYRDCFGDHVLIELPAWESAEEKP